MYTVWLCCELFLSPIGQVPLSVLVYQPWQPSGSRKTVSGFPKTVVILQHFWNNCRFYWTQTRSSWNSNKLQENSQQSHVRSKCGRLEVGVTDMKMAKQRLCYCETMFSVQNKLGKGKGLWTIYTEAFKWLNLRRKSRQLNLRSRGVVVSHIPWNWLNFIVPILSPFRNMTWPWGEGKTKTCISNIKQHIKNTYSTHIHSYKIIIFC